MKCVEVLCSEQNEISRFARNDGDKSPSNFEGVDGAAGRGSLYENAINNVYKNTGFLGRWQVVGKSPLTICDVAHNPAAIELTMMQLQKLQHNNLHIIIGFANDKDIDNIITLLPKDALYYATQAQIERALPAKELFQKLSEANLSVLKVPNVLKAYNQAIATAHENDIIFIGGSFFVVGEFLKNLKDI